MKVSKILGLGAVAAVALTLTACGGKSSSSSSSSNGSYASDQTVNWMESSQLPTMDISLATDEISMNMLNNTNEGIYRLGENNKVEPGLATKTTTSKDGKTWTFKLRHAKWSNGDPVTAQDFVYSWQRTVNPKTGGQYAYIFSGVKNADQIMKGKKAVSTLGVQATGKYSLKVTLDKNIPYFKLLLGFVPYFPQHESFVKAQGKQYGTKATGVLSDGPYKIKGWTGTNDSWSLVKNNSYWDAKNVHLKTLKDQVTKDSGTALNLFQSGKLDEAVLSGSQVKNMLKDSKMNVRPEARSGYLEMNQKKVKAFKNLKIRQAMSYALDRKTFTKNVLGDGSIAAPGFVTKGLAKNPKTGADFTTDADSKGVGITFNAKKAKQLWKEGLKEIGKKSLTINLMSDDTPREKNTAEYVQSQLQKELPGLHVTVSAIPYKQRLDKSAKHQFQMVLTLWGADYSDPSTDLDILTSTNSYNNGQWTNKQYDAYIKAADNAPAGQDQQRWNDMVSAEKVLLKDQGVIPLYQVTMPQLLNPKVKGLIYNTAGTPFNFKEMYVAK
ncbi:peptide ABC transporter substrate-binding protein [Secundilactobacillus muriivasis]